MIKVVGVIRFQVDKENYMYVSLKTSDLPDYTHFSLIKKLGKQWVIPSSKFYPVDDFGFKANAFNDKITKEAKSGKWIYSSVSGIE